MALRKLGRDERKVEKARLRTARPFDDQLPATTFGSAGFDPSRNANFMSQPAFDYWKSRHPKTSAGLSFASRDIGGDNVPEALVTGGDGTTIAVNGWQLRPSRAKYTQPTWAAQGAVRVAHRQEYYDEDLKSIYKQFGKMVVGRAFAAVIHDRGPVPATRKNGEPIHNAKGKQTFRGYSYFSKNVAKVLVGNELDRKMLEAYAADVDRYPQFAGWHAGDDWATKLAVKDSAVAKAAAFLRRSRAYKQELKAKLMEVIQQPNDEAVCLAIMGLVGVDRGTVAPQAIQLAEIQHVPGMAQAAIEGTGSGEQ
jgi:hypothetical protein